MTETQYKRRKMLNNIPLVDSNPTIYDTPKEPLINFPSSIMNGVTKDDGLVSLTFKSITCVEFLEKLDWIKPILFRKDGEYHELSLSNEKFNLEEFKNKLGASSTYSSGTDENVILSKKISEVHDNITKQIDMGTDIKGLSGEIENLCKLDRIEPQEEKYKIHSIKIDTSAVESIASAKDFDLSIYSKRPENASQVEEKFTATYQVGNETSEPSQ